MVINWLLSKIGYSNQVRFLSIFIEKVHGSYLCPTAWIWQTQRSLKIVVVGDKLERQISKLAEVR